MQERSEIILVQFEDGTTIQIQATMIGGMEKVGAKKGWFSFADGTKSIKNIAGENAKVIKDVQPSKPLCRWAFSPGKHFTNISDLQDDFKKKNSVTAHLPVGHWARIAQVAPATSAAAPSQRKLKILRLVADWRAGWAK